MVYGKNDIIKYDRKHYNKTYNHYEKSYSHCEKIKAFLSMNSIWPPLFILIKMNVASESSKLIWIIGMSKNES
jgi:hypothetical protein